MSDYVYNYGDGDKTWTLNEYDSLTIDSDTANHVIGIQESGNITKIVFDNYSSLNVGGRPGSIIVDGVTVVSNEIPTATSENIEITTYDSDIYATTSDSINLDSMGLTPNRIVGIRQVADARTTVVYDTYRALNIWGYPGEVISNGQTIISHDPSQDWGDSSSEDYYESRFGNQVVFLNEDDTINLSSATWDDILGVNIEDNNSMFVFNSFDSLRVYGKPAEAIIGDSTYSINYTNHTITPVTTTTESTTTTTEA